jgi:hypothetical protein
MVPQSVVSFGRSFPLAMISHHGFAYGVHSGRWRSVDGGDSPWRIMIAALAVPLVLLLRILGRVRRTAGDVSLVVKCSPFILWLAVCWAAGEVRGAWRALGARRN